MAAKKTKLWKTGAGAGATFAVLGLAGLADIEQIAGGLICVFGMSLRMALETLPSILLMAWHMLQPCVFGHLRLLEGLLPVTASWQFILTVTRA